MSAPPSRILSARRAAQRRRRAARRVLALNRAPDVRLASSLLFLAREARRELAAFSAPVADPCSCTYDATYLWHAVPAVAARLSPDAELLPGEATDPRTLTRDPRRFRVFAAGILPHLSPYLFRSAADARAPSAGELLGRHPVLGNPFVTALDRIAPPGTSSDGDGRRKPVASFPTLTTHVQRTCSRPQP